MKKTKEQKRDAVLAFVERVCKDGVQPKFDWGSVWLRDGLPMYSLRIESALSMSGYVKDLPDSTISVLYSLTGLETASAVANMNALDELLIVTNEQYERLKAELENQKRMTDVGLDDSTKTIYDLINVIKAERAKSAKLVEALKNVKKAYSLTFAQAFAIEAMEAHKKGANP